MPAFERECRVVSFEARGTGTQSHLPPRRSISEMVDDVRASLEGPAHVLGFSMGGYVALTLALVDPALVRSLSLVATGSGGPGRVPRPRYVADATAEALGLPDPEFAERTMPFTFAPGWVEAQPQRFREIISVRIEHPTPYELLEAHAAACFRFYEEGCDVERITAPALVVHGTQDLIVPVENGRTLAKRLRQARYVEFPDRGHNLMLEDPPALADVVLEFLRSLSAA